MLAQLNILVTVLFVCIYFAGSGFVVHIFVVESIFASV